MLKIRVAAAKKQRRRKKRRFWGPRRLAKLLLVLSVLLYAFYLIEEQIRPVLLSIVDYESKRYALTAFNDAVAEMIEEEPDDYEGLYVITYAADGTIAAIQADTYAMNRLSSELTEKVEKKMNGLEDSPLTLPVGTLLGIQALAGRGPKLRMYILPETYVRAQVYDSLEAAGINQTKLCVYVHFTMEMSVILSGYSAAVTAENDVCLSQVFLVGDVPQSYWGSSGVSSENSLHNSEAGSAEN